MKLKAMHTYQYVRFQNNNENFLSADKATMKDLQLELLPSGIVTVKSGKDSIIVFPTNIAYAIPLNEETAAKVEKGRGALRDVEVSTTRNPGK